MLATKIHALVDASGPSTLLKITAGQANDRRSAATMFDWMGVGDVRRADSDYALGALREALGELGVIANIKPMPNRLRHLASNQSLYYLRNATEQFFRKRHFRAIITRYEKHPDSCLAVVKLTGARIWMRFVGR